MKYLIGVDMVEIHDDLIGGVPALHAVPAGKFDVPLPTIIFFHGYTSSKEIHSYFAYMLAKAGFRTILPEADMHGKRFDGDLKRRQESFWDILKTNIDELPIYKKYLEDANLIDSGRIGVCGTSMGGFSVLGALARYEWIQAAAAYMGSGYFMDISRTLFPPVDPTNKEGECKFNDRMSSIADYDITSKLDRISDRPLFVWHGVKDDIVPYAESDRLLKDLRRLGYDQNLTFIRDEFGIHKVTMDAATAGVTFFESNL